MVRESCLQVKDFCSGNLRNYMEESKDRFTSIDMTILKLDLKMMKDSHDQREERKDV